MPSDNVPPRARSTPDFMTYPYPEAEQILSYLDMLPGLGEETKGCIMNLLNYRAVRTRARLPRGPSAAVLVPLFVGRSGDLYVLLSRRSDVLKTFAGDTALPGGKVDAGDVTVEDTARREAFEEIGLPRDKKRVPLLCVMEPHLAKGQIIVVPVVVLIVDHSLQPNLNACEVTSIFAQPLVSFLSSTGHRTGGRTADPKSPYHTFTDSPWSDGGAIRLHSFLTGRESEGVKPVFGLTASILIKAATIGYGRPPDFEVHPPNAPTSAQQIAYALLTPTSPVRIACEREGVDANKAAARLLRPSRTANAPRTNEWRQIGLAWRKLMVGEDDAVGTSSSGGNVNNARPGRAEGVRKCVEDTKAWVQRQLDDVGAEALVRLVAKAEAYKREARERKAQATENGEEQQTHREDVTRGVATLEAFLDETRDMVNERMKQVKVDPKKLAKARKAYPKVMEKVRKHLEAIRNEDGELDHEALIPEEGQEGLEEGLEAGLEGIKRGEEGMRRGLEEMNKYTRKSGDEHNPEKTLRRKRNAKL